MQIIEQFSVPEFLTFEFFFNTGKYLLFCGLAYLILWKVNHPFKKHNPKPVLTRDLKRDLWSSVRSQLIFLIPTLILVTVGKKYGFFKIYMNVKDHSWAWYFFSYLAMLIYHDTYFYFTHRLMHHQKLYKFFHLHHHLTIYPTPLTAFSFSVGEAIIEGLAIVSFVAIFPMHWSVPAIFTTFSLVMNIYGHLGHNLSEKILEDKTWMKWISHPSHHGWHHRFQKGNYGFYFTFWDRLLGTYKGHIR